MTEGTLLAHLVRRFGVGSENLATETLAYILRTPAAAEGMHEHARRFCPELRRPAGYRTQDWLAADAAIPDLVGFMGDGVVPFLVEVKFGAALTSNQPVTYLHRLLPLSEPGLLLFLVPSARVAPIWGELQRRCAEEGLQLETFDTRPVGQVGDAVVAVTRWLDLLDDIDRRLLPTEHRQVIAELGELRGLCDREDRELFKPFTTEFLGGDIGSRLLDLDELLNEAVSVLVADGKASITGLTRTTGTGYFGRYVNLGGWVCLLYVGFHTWGSLRPTPLWLRITDNRANGYPRLDEALAPLTAETQPRFLNEDGYRRIPIFIPHDAERDVVFAAIDNQLREAQALLLNAPPPVSVPTAPAAIQEG